jgi:arsenate reductase (glutaredoxin)
VGVTTLHGIRNCDTMKKARAWLDAASIEYAFHDYRVQGISVELLRPWLAEHGWQALLNRAGTTFRKLPEAEREGLDEARAMALMLAQPSVIRRPVLDLGARRVIGFTPAGYAAVFG